MNQAVSPLLVEPGPVAANQPAVVDAQGPFTHADIGLASARVAGRLLAGRSDLAEARVALLVEPGFAFPAALWGVWRAGGVAVPLALSHPAAELDYVLGDTGAEAVIASPGRLDTLAPLAAARGLRLISTAEALTGEPGTIPEVEPGRRALIVYTSGTTSRPKGAVWTHHGLGVQVSTLLAAWGWRRDDRALLALPLHHVHGLINVLCCALAAGACCEMVPKFDPRLVWQRLASGEVTVWMAVPTLYHRLVAAWDEASPEEQACWAREAAKLRLMVSGSAALPVQLFERWREITGHALLERYGMTEIGMALSNPLQGERRPGTVGQPLPGVAVRIVDERGHEVAPGSPGGLEVAGEGLFREYWRRPEATAETFRDGWFVTGDTAVVEDGRFRILGRSSVDIVKSGGYKISALEIEAVLRDHPAVADCAVLGLPDEEWGERVGAAVELAAGATLDLEELKSFCRERLAPYKIPRSLVLVAALPRNAMGKVVKAEVKGLFGGRAVP